MKRKALLGCVVALGTIQFTVWGATLTNRYSFTSDASDSISGKNGVLMNGATISGGQAVILSGGLNSGDPSGQYVALPGDLFTNYSSVTLEVWITPTLDDFTAGAEWSRVWDFGNSDGTNGIAPFIWLRSGNNNIDVRGDMVGLPANTLIETTTRLRDGQENHIVWTTDAATSQGKIYINGVRAASSDTVLNSPASIGSMTNSWLGRSQFAPDTYLTAAYNEFRVYNGAINPLEIVADYQNGAGTYPASYGTVTNIQLRVGPFTPATLIAGTGLKAQVLAAATGLTNKAVDIADSTLSITYTSGNTNILTIDSNATVVAIAPAPTNIFVTATFGSLSATQQVKVVSAAPIMLNRYSFTSDATDSIRGSNGALSGAGATISGGRVLLDGVNGYVQLPAYLLTSTNLQTGAFTIESWATVYPTSSNWSRLFDFGNVVGSSGQNYTFLSVNPAALPTATTTRFVFGTVGSENLIDATTTLRGQTNVHVAAIFNPNPAQKHMEIFINGALTATFTNVTKALSTLNNAYSFIGLSLFSADAKLAGEVDEFRIYDGELDRFQLAASYQAGPNTTNFSVGSFVSFTLNTGGSMPKDDLRQARPIVNFTLATNVDISGDPNVTTTSADTNVVTVNSAGVMSSHNVGTTTVTGVFKYISGSTTNLYTNTASITVFRNPAAVLQHRYSFNTDATDSVGTAHGTLMNNATISGGKLFLPGTNMSYLDLPATNVNISSNQAATIEAWVVFRTNSAWARLFDFGSTTNVGTNTTGPQNFWWAGPTDGAFFRSDIATTAGFANIIGNPPLLNGQTIHLVVIYDPTNAFMAAYTNGVLYEINSTAANVPLSSVSTDDAWIGRSQFGVDPLLKAEIDELRIYNGVLYADEIKATDVLGTGQLLAATATLSVSRSGNNLIITWPLASAGFSLQSRSSLVTGSWAPVSATPQIVSSNWQVTVPITGTAQFFRLVK